MKLLGIIFLGLILGYVSIVFAEQNPYAVISVSNPEIKVLSSNVFSWSDKSRYVYDDERLGGFPLKDKFQSDIKDKLTANGYIFSDNENKASMVVGYVIALESSLNDMDINSLYGINPGYINKDNTKLGNDYEKGTIIIDILEARTQRSIWRGAIQGMAEFGIPDSERETRLKSAVDTLLSEFIKIYGPGKNK